MPLMLDLGVRRQRQNTNLNVKKDVRMIIDLILSFSYCLTFLMKFNLNGSISLFCLNRVTGTAISNIVL